jgi:hypothetical protein
VSGVTDAITDSRQLITFDSPPVNEVALAVQFTDPVVDLELLAALARNLKGDFPQQQQQPPLPRMVEAVSSLGPPQFEFQFGATSFPRTWFLSSEGHRLVQVQSDRIVLNWRRLEGSEPYPRYGSLYGVLSDLLTRLHTLAEEAGKTPINVNFCEISYINEIAVPGVETGQSHPDLSRIISLVTDVRGREFLPQAEDAQFQARWRIPPDQLPPGTPVGRLYVAVGPAFRAATQLPIYTMNLTSRIVPAPFTELMNSLDILDIGHEWIVRAFADLTTEEMHAVWERRD